MSERYTKVFSLPTNLYVENSPVIVSAGALLKDNQTGDILAQLKIKNVSNNIIKAVKLSITLFDTLGKQLPEKITYEYLDLEVVRDDDFGQKVPIAIIDKSARAMSVCITEICFVDNSVWEYNGEEWNCLKEQEKLLNVLNNDELVKQYKIEYGESCEFFPIKDKDLWICSCGAFNKLDEEECHLCKASLDTLFSVNIDDLKNSCTERTTKHNKIKKIGVMVIAVVLVFVLIFSLLSNSIRYNKALSCYESGDKVNAVKNFIKLGNYKDSQKYLMELFSEDEGITDIYNYLMSNKTKFPNTKLGTDNWDLVSIHKDFYCNLGKDNSVNGEINNRDLNEGYWEWGEVRKLTQDIYIIYGGEDLHFLRGCNCQWSSSGYYNDSNEDGVIIMKRIK